MKPSRTLTRLLSLLLALCALTALCACRIEFSGPSNKNPSVQTDSSSDEQTTAECTEETTEQPTEETTDGATEDSAVPKIVEIQLSEKGDMTLFYYVSENRMVGESIHHVKKFFARIAGSNYTHELSVSTLRDYYESVSTSTYYDLIYVIYDIPNYPYNDKDKVVSEKFGILSGYQ